MRAESAGTSAPGVSTATIAAKLSTLPGFMALSDQVFMRPGRGKPEAPASGPDTVIFGCGEGQARHVARYADGYRRLFPRARQIVVLSRTARAAFSDLRQRSRPMMAVVEALGEGTGTLVHSLSDVGGCNYAATLHAYRETRDAVLPHRLLVLDSAPGAAGDSAALLGRWARAVAGGTAGGLSWAGALA